MTKTKKGMGLELILGETSRVCVWGGGGGRGRGRAGRGGQHTCDMTRFRRDLPILGSQIRVTPDRPKLPIYMNSDFSLLPKAKTCFPITADACFI